MQILPSLSRRAILLMLAALAAVILLERAHTYGEPFDRDIGDYAVTAHQIMHGYTLYGDYMDQKPPGIHLTYAAAELIAGYGRPAIFMINILGSLLAMLALYKAGSVGRFGIWGGIWSAAIWTVIGGHLSLEANQPNSELFLNFWIALAVASLLHTADLKPNFRRAIGIGLCFAAATLYKHSIGVVPAFTCGAYMLFPPFGRKRWDAIIEVAVMAAVVVLSWGLVFGYFWLNHRGHSFIAALVTYNQSYAGDVGSNLRDSLSLSKLFPPPLYITLPLIALIAAGLFIAATRAKERAWLVWLAWAASTEIAVALPGRFYPHYYQLWLPVLITGAGWGIASLALPRAAPLGIARWAGAATLIVLMLWEGPNYLKSPTQWSQMKYGDIFVRSDKLAKQIDKILEPGETFYQLGAETQLYLETGRPAPRMLADYGLAPNPLLAQIRRDTLEDLERLKPELLVISAYTYEPRNGPIFAYCMEHFEAAPSDWNQSPFFLFVRKGGALEKRWKGLPE